MTWYESEEERRHVREAKRKGWLCWKFQTPGVRGAPDRFYARNGKVVFIAWKAPGKEPMRLQWHRIRDLRQQGLIAEYADSEEIADSILDGLVSVPAPNDKTHPGTRLLPPVGGDGPGEDGGHADSPAKSEA